MNQITREQHFAMWRIAKRASELYPLFGRHRLRVYIKWDLQSVHRHQFLNLPAIEALDNFHLMKGIQDLEANLDRRTGYCHNGVYPHFIHNQ